MAQGKIKGKVTRTECKDHSHIYWVRQIYGNKIMYFIARELLSSTFTGEILPDKEYIRIN